MSNLSKKYKEYSYTHYYRGIELNVVMVSTSIKKLAELFNYSPATMRKYTYVNEPRTKECIDNPEVVYAEVGMGGEGRAAFDSEVMYTFVEFKTIIDKHRETYSTYRDFLEKTNEQNKTNKSKV